MVDASLYAVMQKRLERTVQNLEKNGMPAFVVRCHDELMAKLEEWIADGTTVAFGGSMTLRETGVLGYLRTRNVKLLDRDQDGLTPEQVRSIFLASFDADTYLVSTNALTEQGELYNVDGRGNRVAAMTYGPKNVIVVVGCNKIVPDLKHAYERVRAIAAPANAVRLQRNTPCVTTGVCMDCASAQRICCTATVHAYQLEQGRIKVLILDDAFGY